MSIPLIFGLFSRRDRSPGKASTRLTQEFRNRTLQLCADTLSGYQEFPNLPGLSVFWSDIHKKLRILHGRPNLSSQRTGSLDDDAVEFLVNSSDEHFLDFVELIFQSEVLWRALERDALVSLVRDINIFLKVDDLPYALTEIAFTSERGKPYATVRIVALPQIIRRENQVLHETAIEPTLTLLTNPAFASANKEFLEALEDYRKGDYRDCVVKCGSSLESAMKIICDRKKWPYQRSDKTARLLNIILQMTDLEPFFKHPLTLVATIRNELSSAHGAGTQPRAISKHVASFVVNSTASTILLLVEEAGL